MQPGPDDLVDAMRRAGVRDERLLDAFRATPRESFVPRSQQASAYEDRPLPIPHGQVTTQPSLSALLIDSLGPRPTNRILEVGTGHGFQTALLARLCDRVTSIERWEDLARQARLNLASERIDNVEVLVGDGSRGVPGAAPFDGVIVSAAFTDVPGPLVEQLAEGGRLVQPIGPGGRDTVTLFRKVGGELHPVREVIPAHFVRLIGEDAYPDEGR